MGRHSAPRSSRPDALAGVLCSFSKVQQSHVDSLLLIAERTVADVSRHEPSVIKDPRLSWTFHFWKPMLERPMCVLVYKDPIDNAISLAENYEKSSAPRALQFTVCRNTTVCVGGRAAKQARRHAGEAAALPVIWGCGSGR